MIWLKNLIIYLVKSVRRKLYVDESQAKNQHELSTSRFGTYFFNVFFFFSISCPTFSIFFDFLANSPTKATSMESRTSKSSPQKTSSTSQPLHTISSSTHAALQPLLNMTSSTLTPSAYTSSSGKRKASNPQKFTRFREVSLLDSTDNLSPSHLPANMGASVGSALQFIPSVISSMMQQHMENEAQREVSWQGGFPVFVRVVFILSVSC